MVGGPPGYAAVIDAILDNFLQFGTQGYHEYKTLIDAMTFAVSGNFWSKVWEAVARYLVLSSVRYTSRMLIDTLPPEF